MKPLLKKITLLFILLITFASCNCCPGGEPIGNITEAKATEIQENYEELVSLEMNAILGSLQPMQTNFDILELEKYICMVKEQSKNLGYKGTLGLSTYFGVEIDSVTNVKTLKIFFSPTNKTGDEVCNILGIDRLNFGSGLMPPSYSTICTPQ